MATRISSEVLPTRITNTEYQGSNPGNIVSDSLTYIDHSGSFSGVSNPNWKSAVASKSSATTVASGVKRDLSMPDMYQEIVLVEFFGLGNTIRRTSRGQLQREFLQEITVGPQVIDDEARNQALSSFLRKCKSTQRQFQSGVFLGELREAIRLVRHPTIALRRTVSSFASAARTLFRSNKRNFSKQLSNLWLQYSFGIIPLISDIEDGKAALNRLAGKRFCANVQAFKSVSLPLSSESFVVEGYAMSFRVERNKSYTASRLLKGQVYVESNGSISEVRQSIGLTLRDFIPTVYELIPYSFLVDYFSNLGEIIESWSFCQGDIAWHTDSFRQEGLCIVNCIPLAPPKIIFGNVEVKSYSMAPAQSFYRRRSFSRGSSPLGLPSLGFRLPGTSTKFLNLAALASLRVL